ncbi:uncharacterized protein LOC126840920 [Adelges cooleyi]|uniref:uncharacterized protein LOC126840920 n=1 Tax=Adelges cooleyi TaxID=133065 RepID=UPI00217F812C|nr:uncharacterized protein LOC126840920 [Adelges cooleyi]XP_050432893.1 uncharacterized protein LOC126840920 [Adelges cooleyi]
MEEDNSCEKRSSLGINETHFLNETIGNEVKASMVEYQNTVLLGKAKSLHSTTLQLCNIEDEPWEVEDNIERFDDNIDYQNVHEVFEKNTSIVHLKDRTKYKKNCSAFSKINKFYNSGTNLETTNNSVIHNNPQCDNITADQQLKNSREVENCNAESDSSSDTNPNELKFYDWESDSDDQQQTDSEQETDKFFFLDTAFDAVSKLKVNMEKENVITSAVESKTFNVVEQNLEHQPTREIIDTLSPKFETSHYDKSPEDGINIFTDREIKEKQHDHLNVDNNLEMFDEPMETDLPIEFHNKPEDDQIESSECVQEYNFEEKSTLQIEEDVSIEDYNKSQIDFNTQLLSCNDDVEIIEEEPDIVDPDIKYNIQLNQHFKKMDLLVQRIAYTPDDLSVLDECMQLPPIPEMEQEPKKFTTKERIDFYEGESHLKYQIDRDDWNKILVKRAAVFTAHAGFDLTSEESLYVMADISIDYIKKLAKTLKKHFDAQHTDSKSSLLNPVERSLMEVGIQGGPAKLIEFIRKDVFERRNRLRLKCEHYQLIIDQFVKRMLMNTGVNVSDSNRTKNLTTGEGSTQKENNTSIEQAPVDSINDIGEVLNNETDNIKAHSVSNNASDPEMADMLNAFYNTNTQEIITDDINAKRVKTIDDSTDTEVKMSTYSDTNEMLPSINASNLTDTKEKSSISKNLNEQNICAKLNDNVVDPVERKKYYLQEEFGNFDWPENNTRNNSNATTEDVMDQSNQQLDQNQSNSAESKDLMDVNQCNLDPFEICFQRPNLVPEEENEMLLLFNTSSFSHYKSNTISEHSMCNDNKSQNCNSSVNDNYSGSTFSINDETGRTAVITHTNTISNKIKPIFSGNMPHANTINSSGSLPELYNSNKEHRDMTIPPTSVNQRDSCIISNIKN